MSIYDGKAIYNDILKATEDFDATYCIGKGGYGAVYKARLPSGNTVAVKKLHPLPEKEDCRGFLNERRAGDEESTKLDRLERVNIIKGVAHALSYMHHDCTPPIVHRDISSKNILIDEEYEAHVSDFGTAKLLKLDSSNCICRHIRIRSTSFGVLALEVIKEKHPGDFFSPLSTPVVENVQLRDVLDQRLSPSSPEFEEVMMSIVKSAIACLNSDPKSRPTMHIVSQLQSTTTIPYSPEDSFNHFSSEVITPKQDVTVLLSYTYLVHQ
ncbi:hypothetical protein Vadar_032018 [Vaccinium darrowii]|uniref:Uncharacterized protein n=1 Tax=Vaccinium darrowii TaxID=229202 RepID=A0ACB7XUT8_9ERIC|nr:hypothetical protein Vadar_032018 [Vaccinium darrowii]